MKSLKGLMLLIVAILLGGCNAEELEKKTLELNLLKQQQKKDSLLLDKFTKEMEAVNILLDTIASVDEYLRESEEISKVDALTKLEMIDSLLNDKNTQIEELTTEIQSLKSKFAKSVAMGKISEGKSQLEIKSKYYKELNKQIAALEQDNLDLKDIISQKDIEINERDSIIRVINAERTKQQEKLEELQAEIIASAKELADATNATADRYFDLAIDLRNIADKTSIIFNKKKKRNLVKMSYSYLKRANELGHPDASKEISFMETDKKYSKLIGTQE